MATGWRIRACTVLLALAGGRMAAAQDTSTLVRLDLYATISSASVIAFYSGDADADGLAWVEHRPAGAATWSIGHPLARLGGGRWAGSVLHLPADADREIRVLVDDPDNTGPVWLEGQVRTRVGTPLPGTGRDHWVDAAAGSDTNPGTRLAPFRTIQRGADAAQPGDTVHVLPGVYREQVRPPRGGTPGALLSFVAEGAGVILDGSDPALIGGAPWTDHGGGLYSTAFAGESIYAAIDDQRIYDYQTLADLQAENGNIGQPGVIPGGFFVDAAAGRLYLITPDHTSPLAHRVYVAVLPSAFLLDGLGDVAIEGFEIRYYGREAGYGSVGIDLRDTARSWIRGNHIHHLNQGVRVRRALASENVIEDNSIRDTGVYGWPWDAVKAHTAEASGIALTGGFGNVVRCNRIEGQFNGIYSGAFGNPDEEIARDTDVHDNRLRYHGDDGLELEGAQRNVRQWSNVVRDAYNMVSISPIELGPVFLVRNLLWGYRAHALKVNNGTYGHVFVYHTTAVPLDGGLYPGAQALAPSIPFAALVGRNNIWEANRYVIEYGQTTLLGPVSLDHDGLWTHDSEGAGRYVKWLNQRYPDQAALAASGTIETNAIQVEPAYVDAALGDFRPVTGSPLVDAGIVLPGINDDFAGAGPDLGAVERDAAPVAGCPAAAAAPVLLRNAQWPVARELIFTGPPPACPPPLDPGCPAPGRPALSLDPFGPDCTRGGSPTDDDHYLAGFSCGAIEPEAGLLADSIRPLVFYQLDASPSACNRLRLAKDGLGSYVIDCP